MLTIITGQKGETKLFENKPKRKLAQHSGAPMPFYVWENTIQPFFLLLLNFVSINEDKQERGVWLLSFMTNKANERALPIYVNKVFGFHKFTVFFLTTKFSRRLIFCCPFNKINKIDWKKKKFK